MTEDSLYQGSCDLQQTFDSIKMVGKLILLSHPYRYGHFVDSSPAGKACVHARLTHKAFCEDGDTDLLAEISQLIALLNQNQEFLCQTKQS